MHRGTRVISFSLPPHGRAFSPPVKVIPIFFLQRQMPSRCCSLSSRVERGFLPQFFFNRLNKDDKLTSGTEKFVQACRPHLLYSTSFPLTFYLPSKTSPPQTFLITCCGQHQVPTRTHSPIFVCYHFLRCSSCQTPSWNFPRIFPLLLGFGFNLPLF